MPSAGVDNTQRRKWDKDEYAARAAEREKAEDEKYGGKDGKPARPPAGAIVERKELNVSSIIQRDYKKELEARVGTKTIVNLDTGEGLGFKCKETGVILKDSMAYLDHINGKKQQKALGMSMRVERSTVDQVKARFESAKRKKAEAEDAKVLDFAARVAAAAEEEERLRAERQERKKAKKEAKKGNGGDDGLGEMDPEMAAMMGFAGFGGGKK
jgi:U4/U6.U5 tri-snRNP component SNU23